MGGWENVFVFVKNRRYWASGWVVSNNSRDTCGWIACVNVFDSTHCMNTLYLLAEETEIVSTSVKVLCLCWFITMQFERLVEWTYTLYLCLWKIEDIERVAGWYPTTRGIRVGELLVWMCLIVHTVWTRCISWLRRPRSYPRLLRYCACVDSLQCSLNVSLNEHIRHILRARLNGKAHYFSVWGVTWWA